MKILIKEYQQNDWKQIISLMSEFGAYLEEIDNMRRTQFKEGGAKYFTEKMLKEARERNGKIYVAHIRDKVIGFIGGYIGSQNKENRMEEIQTKPGIINEFYVAKQYRSKGIGKRLLTKLENYFKSQTCDIVRLVVFAPNRLARQFYALQGYKERSFIIMKPLK